MKKFEGYMRGLNLGGWISQCTDHYNHEHYQSFITEADIEKIAGYGLDHVRLPIDYNVIQNEDGTFIEEGFQYIDLCLSWCHKNNLNVVIDLHKCCGFVFDDDSYCDFFHSEQMQEYFIILWQELARRYGHLPYVAFELLNEVTKEEMANPWNEIIKLTVPKIREIAPDVTIIVGGIYNSSIYGLTLMEAPCDDNMVYTFHCYSPLVFTHQGAYWVPKMPTDYRVAYPKDVAYLREESKKIFGLDFDDEYACIDPGMIDETYFKVMFEKAIQVAEKYDVPLYCGEYGVIDLADCESTVSWYKDIHKAFEAYEIARCAWTYKAMDYGITQEHCKDIHDTLVNIMKK